MSGIYMCICIYVCEWVSDSHSVISDSLWPMDSNSQAPLSMECSRQEYWSGLPCPSPGNLSNTGVKHGSPTLQADSLPSETPGKPIYVCMLNHVWLFATPWAVVRQALRSWNFPGKNTAVVCHALLQGMFPTQGPNLHLFHFLHRQAGSRTTSAT